MRAAGRWWPAALAWGLALALVTPWPAAWAEGLDAALGDLWRSHLAWSAWLTAAGRPRGGEVPGREWLVELGLACLSAGLVGACDAGRGAAPGALLVEGLAGMLLFAALGEAAWRAARVGWAAYAPLWCLALFAPPSLAAAAGWMIHGELSDGFGTLARCSPVAALPLAAGEGLSGALLAPAGAVCVVLWLSTYWPRGARHGVS